MMKYLVFILSLAVFPIAQAVTAAVMPISATNVPGGQSGAVTLTMSKGRPLKVRFDKEYTLAKSLPLKMRGMILRDGVYFDFSAYDHKTKKWEPFTAEVLNPKIEAVIDVYYLRWPRVEAISNAQMR